MTTPQVPDAAVQAMTGHQFANRPELDEETFAAPLQRSGAIQNPDATFPHQDDYFGFDHQERWMFPDGVSWLLLQALNEGRRKEFLNQSNRRLSIKKATGDAELNVAAGDEKHTLLRAAIVGWNLVRNGQPINFTPKLLNEWLSVANPKLVDSIEAKIHEMNPWLDGEVTIEALREEITRLEEVLARKIEEEEGKDTSEK